MKKLLLALTLGLCFNLQAQNSFKLKNGSVLVYEVMSDTSTFNLEVTVENVSPMRLSYKSSNGARRGTLVNSVAKNNEPFDYDYFMPIPASKTIPEGGATVLLPKTSFKKIQLLEENFRNGVENDTTTIRFKLARKGEIVFSNIGFQQEAIDVEGEELRLHTYAIDEFHPHDEDDFIGYIMRVNIDSDYPYVTFIYDMRNKFYVNLKQAKNVELYEYIR